MEPRPSEEDAAERLRCEYVQLKRDIFENDERIDAARRENAGQLKKLNKLLQKRGLLADQVCQFARQFAECHDSLVEMESLRHLCRTNTEHICSLTSAIANLQDEVVCPAAAEEPVQRCGAESSGWAASDSPTADDQRAPSRGHGERLRPKVEFREFLDRMDGPKATTRRSKRHSEGDLGAEKRGWREEARLPTAAGAAPGTRIPVGSRPQRPSSRGSACWSALAYALVLVAALSAVPLRYAAGNWCRVLGEYCRRLPVEAPPLQPAAPLTILQRVRRWV